jgi:hypothetical protein
MLESLACRLQEARPNSPYALAALMAQVIALTASAAPELSRAPFDETFPASGRQCPVTVTDRGERNPPRP